MNPAAGRIGTGKIWIWMAGAGQLSRLPAVPSFGGSSRGRAVRPVYEQENAAKQKHGQDDGVRLRFREMIVYRAAGEAGSAKGACSRKAWAGSRLAVHGGGQAQAVIGKRAGGWQGGQTAGAAAGELLHARLREVLCQKKEEQRSGPPSTLVPTCHLEQRLEETAGSISRRIHVSRPRGMTRSIAHHTPEPDRFLAGRPLGMRRIESSPHRARAWAAIAARSLPRRPEAQKHGLSGCMSGSTSRLIRPPEPYLARGTIDLGS